MLRIYSSCGLVRVQNFHLLQLGFAIVSSRKVPKAPWDRSYRHPQLVDVRGQTGPEACMERRVPRLHGSAHSTARATRWEGVGVALSPGCRSQSLRDARRHPSGGIIYKLMLSILKDAYKCTTPLRDMHMASYKAGLFIYPKSILLKRLLI